MAYVKAFFLGIAFALLAGVLWILAVFVIPLVVPILFERLTDDGGGGAGASYAYFSTGPLLLVALVGFAVGFVWQLRRNRAPR
jgi:hypothetical protein